MNDIFYKGLEHFGRFYGTYVGFVVAHGEDNQIKVTIPEVYGNPTVRVWAMPKIYGGKGYGMQNLPELSDAVWISFRHGHAEFPMWEHGYYGKEEIPEDFEDVNVKGIITPAGVKVLLNGSVITAHNTEKYGFTINEEKVIIGKDGEAKEPAVLGDTAVDLLEELIDLITQMVFVTPAGNTTGLVNTPQFLVLKQKLITMKAKSLTLD